MRLAAHPLVGNAKLISEMERGWQAKNAELMASAISTAKKVKLEKALVKVYAQRYKQLAIEEKLTSGIAGDVALLHAAYEQARLIEYAGSLLADAEGKLKKYKNRKTTGALLLDDNAVGARKFGSWRENPTWKITVQKKTTVFIAVNEDGELDAASQAKLESKKAKKAAQYERAKDKMAATQVSQNSARTQPADASQLLPSFALSLTPSTLSLYPRPPVPSAGGNRRRSEERRARRRRQGRRARLQRARRRQEAQGSEGGRRGGGRLLASWRPRGAEQ